MSDDPTPADQTEARLVDLEVRLSFMERTLSELDDVVRQVADDMDNLRRAVTELKDRVDTGTPTDGDQGSADLQYEKPPHY